MANEKRLIDANALNRKKKYSRKKGKRNAMSEM